MIFQKTKTDKLKTTRTSGIFYYSDMSNSFINRLSSAARKESWKTNVVTLAWTAGPVTYLALQGGYMISYGKSAPSNLFIYFAMYTAIAGIIAIGFRVLFNAIKSNEREELSRRLKDVMGFLTVGVLMVRNKIIESYDPDQRNLIAAEFILDNPDAGRPSVYSSVASLLGTDAAEYLNIIEAYRQSGLFPLVHANREKAAALLAKKISSIKKQSPLIARLLEKRLTGKVPEKKEGRRRGEGFIERILRGGEQNSLDLLRLSDVIDVMTLVFEIIGGRKIPYFSVRYAGSRIFISVSEALERNRRHYRRSVFTRNAMLRILIEEISEFDDSFQKLPPRYAMQNLEECNEHLIDSYTKLFTERIKEIKKRRGRTSDVTVSAAKAEMQSLKERYRCYREANEECVRRRRELLNSTIKYQRLLNEIGESIPLSFESRKRQRYIHVEKKTIELTEKEQSNLARDLFPLIENIEIKEYESGYVLVKEDEHASGMNAEDYKELAVQFAAVLDAYLHIGKQELQQAIESCNGPNLLSLEWGITSEYKIGWGLALINEIRLDEHRALYGLLKSLFQFHGLSVSEDVRSYLIDSYGFSDEEIDLLISGKERKDVVLSEPITVPPLDKTLRF